MNSFKALMLTAAAAVTAATATAQNNFTIDGTIDGIDHGRLVVLAKTALNRTDTLAAANFEGNSFRLEGRVAETTPAMIMLQGFDGGFFFFAEPDAHFTANLSNGAYEAINGTETMKQWYEYTDMVNRFNAQIPAMRREANELRNAGKFRSASEMNDRIGEVQQQAREAVEQYMQQHDGIIPAHVAETKAAKIQNSAQLKELYEQLGDEGKNSLSGRLILERKALLDGIAIGSKAPDFTLADANGNEVRMSEIKGRLKILDFWASWCGPCRMNNPELKKLYEEYNGKGLEIIGISLDEKGDAWRAAIEKDGLTWTNVSSLKGWKCDVVKLYSVDAVPSMFVLDADNRIVATGLRGETLHRFVSDNLD